MDFSICVCAHLSQKALSRIWMRSDRVFPTAEFHGQRTPIEE